MDNRVITIEREKKTQAFALISICNDISEHKNKDMFEYKHHDPHGTICYVDRIVGKGVSIGMIKHLRDIVCSNFKNVKKANWFRDSKNGGRLVTVFKDGHARIQNKILQSV